MHVACVPTVVFLPNKIILNMAMTVGRHQTPGASLNGLYDITIFPVWTQLCQLALKETH